MKPSPVLISLAVLVHLAIVDFSMFLMTTELSVHTLLIIGYNLVWLLVASMIVGQRLKEVA